MCKGKNPELCDDGNACTDDLCDFKSGCVHVDHDGPCNDLNACTANEFCADSKCGGGVAVNCNDGNVCTDDSCDPKTGCQNTPNNASCDDGNACTESDKCADAACKPGNPKSCDDGNVCTNDSCLKDSGCQHTNVQDQTPCGGGNVCVAGSCTSPCQPGNKTFAFTGAVEQWIVPTCAKTVTLEAWGAAGGYKSNPDNAGKGGYAKGTSADLAGKTVYVFVGGQGSYSGIYAVGGFNGGGGHTGPYGYTIGGGGASDVRVGGQELSSRIIVGGGGGGSAWTYESSAKGGHGGGLQGNNGGTHFGDNAYGKGGTQNAGGQAGYFQCWAEAGALGKGGAGANCNSGHGGSGAAGGGYYGGGGADHSGGGGGGSSYTGNLQNASTQTGVRSGNGQITISWQ